MCVDVCVCGGGGGHCEGVLGVKYREREEYEVVANIGWRTAVAIEGGVERFGEHREQHGCND